MARLNPLIAAAGGLITLLMAWSNQCAMAGMEQRNGSQHPTEPMLLAQAQPAQPRQDVEANISELHQKLQITAAQEPQFGTVANVIRYITGPDDVVLDYACGEALSAASVADACGQLYLAEPAPGVRGRLIVRERLRCDSRLDRAGGGFCGRYLRKPC